MNERSVSKGIVAGMIAGAVGTWAMGWAQKAWQQVERNVDSIDEDAGGDGEPATVQAANQVSIAVRDRELMENEKAGAGQAVHYGMGMTSGAIYGAATEIMPVASVGFGIPFGLVLFGIADEVAVPAAGLSEPPAEIPAEVHARGLVAHVAYGLVTELTRRVVRDLID